jgi:hypothetical protein
LARTALAQLSTSSRIAASFTVLVLLALIPIPFA